MSELTCRDVSANATTASWRVSVSSDLSFFDGHFDGFPVLPGVAQLDAVVLSQVERLFPDLGRLERCSRLKFRDVIKPGDDLIVEVSRASDRAKTVSFAVTKSGADGVRASDGLLHFAEADR